MSRVPYFSGPLSGSLVHSPAPSKDFLEDTRGISSLIGKALDAAGLSQSSRDAAERRRLVTAQADTAEHALGRTRGAETALQKAMLGFPPQNDSHQGGPYSGAAGIAQQGATELPSLGELLSGGSVLGNPTGMSNLAGAPSDPEATPLGEIVVTGRRRAPAAAGQGASAPYARAALAEHITRMDPNTPSPGDWPTEAQHRELDQRAFNQWVGANLPTLLGTHNDPETLGQILSLMAASRGLDGSVVRFNAAGGKYLGKDDAVSLDHQNTVRLTNFVHDLDKNDADNARAVEVAQIGANQRRDTATANNETRVEVARMNGGRKGKGKGGDDAAPARAPGAPGTTRTGRSYTPEERLEQVYGPPSSAGARDPLGILGNRPR